MAGYGWVSFTTDYGLDDGFVATCHGIIGRLAPAARVIDVTHQITPGDVRRAAAVLADTAPHLPPAVHLAVVDPGVGTRRRAVAIETPGGPLVGPDNGLLPWAADALGGPRAAVVLDNPDWHLSPVSRTFHGRDIFAPVAARLAGGEPITRAGTPIDPAGLVRLPQPQAGAGEGWLAAEVLSVDRFGNLQLAGAGPALAGVASAGERVTVATTGRTAAGRAESAPAERTAAGGPGGAAAGVAAAGVSAGGGTEPAVVGGTFADAQPGELVVLVDSAGRVAVAVNGGHAADRLGAGPGDLIRIVADRHLAVS